MGKDDWLAALAIAAIAIGVAGYFSKPKCPACKNVLQDKPSRCPHCRTPLTWRS